MVGGRVRWSHIINISHHGVLFVAQRRSTYGRQHMWSMYDRIPEPILQCMCFSHFPVGQPIAQIVQISFGWYVVTVTVPPVHSERAEAHRGHDQQPSFWVVTSIEESRAHLSKRVGGGCCRRHSCGCDKRHGGYHCDWFVLVAYSNHAFW